MESVNFILLPWQERQRVKQQLAEANVLVGMGKPQWFEPIFPYFPLYNAGQTICTWRIVMEFIHGIYDPMAHLWPIYGFSVWAFAINLLALGFSELRLQSVGTGLLGEAMHSRWSRSFRWWRRRLVVINSIKEAPKERSTLLISSVIYLFDLFWMIINYRHLYVQ